MYFKSSLIFILLFFSLGYAKTLRIMPLGDSITYDNNTIDRDKDTRPKGLREAYRSHLWYMLQDAKKNVDFVGTKSAGEDVTPAFDPDNEGYPGDTSYDIAERIYHLLQKDMPDVILLHIGSNDNDSSIEGVNKILDWIDTYESVNSVDILVIVALIIDKREASDTIKTFNKNLSALVHKRWKNGDSVMTIDIYSKAGLTTDDYRDRVHPNKNGYKKIAKQWFKALNTPYKPYSSAPIARNDSINANTGESVHINVLLNDSDPQNDINNSTVHLVNGIDTTGNGIHDTYHVEHEGIWTANQTGIVSFTPENTFTQDPSIIQYTVRDIQGNISQPATISINYVNTNLETYATSLVPSDYIQSTSIDETTNSIEIITLIPDKGIRF